MATSTTGVWHERAPMREGDTPLIDATRHGRLADVQALLSGGADVNEPKTNDSGATALCIAAQEGHMEVVAALLAAGAHVNEPKTMPKTDGSGATALCIAAQQGHMEVVAALLAAGARVDEAEAGEDGATPLLVAAIQGHAEVVSALLAAGAEVDPICQDPENNAPATTPLFAACVQGHADVVSALLNAGASIDWSDRHDRATPLIAASQQGHVEVLTVLLAAGATVSQTDDDGRMAMVFACAVGHLTCVKLLSLYGATRSWQLQEGEGVATAEEIATSTDNDDLTSWLVESRLWSTPLHHLRIIGATRARELLRGGADLHAAAAAGGPTPLSLAQALRAAGDAAAGSAASLVLAAAEPWGPRTNSLFPVAARTFAAELLLIGHQLSCQPRSSGQEISLVDVWTQLVMPFVVVR